jgi:hypothetical protein
VLLVGLVVSEAAVYPIFDYVPSPFGFAALGRTQNNSPPNKPPQDTFLQSLLESSLSDVLPEGLKLTTTTTTAKPAASEAATTPNPLAGILPEGLSSGDAGTAVENLKGVFDLYNKVQTIFVDDFHPSKFQVQ